MTKQYYKAALFIVCLCIHILVAEKTTVSQIYAENPAAIGLGSARTACPTEYASVFDDFIGISKHPWTLSVSSTKLISDSSQSYFQGSYAGIGIGYTQTSEFAGYERDSNNVLGYKISQGEKIAIGSYAHSITDTLALGIRYTHLQRDVSHIAQAQGSFFDLGATLDLNKIVIGYQAINIGRSKLTWSTETAENFDSGYIAGAYIPVLGAQGWAPAESTVNIIYNYSSLQRKSHSLGCDVSFSQYLTLRCGLLRTQGASAENTTETINSPSLGLSLHIMQFHAAYGYQPEGDVGFPVHSMSISFYPGAEIANATGIDNAPSQPQVLPFERIPADTLVTSTENEKVTPNTDLPATVNDGVPIEENTTSSDLKTINNTTITSNMDILKDDSLFGDDK